MPRLRAIPTIFLILFLSFLAFGCDRVAQEKYDKIKIGMTFQEVEKLLGSSPTCDSAVGMKNCTWGTADKHIKVQFVADKVVLHSAKGLK
jgi:hypothetical protein